MVIELAKTNFQDPGSSEIISPHVSGLQEAVGKIEDALDINTASDTGISLSEVYISSDDRYRIYQAPKAKRNWLSSPAPVIKKNGGVITEGFTIDYGGGAIILSSAALDTDTFTADVTYTINTSNEISTTKSNLSSHESASNPHSGSASDSDLSTHTSDTGNPHSVSYDQAGAAPAAKGVTNGDSHDHSGGDGAQIDHTTLANKGTNTHSQIDSHIANTSNPHSVDKSDVGLGNVENKSAATIRTETGQLKVEVVSSFPAHSDGKIIAHTGDSKAYVSIGGEWV